MYDVVYLFRGMLIGLMVSVPLGPMGVLIIQKTLQKGALAGFIAGMGAVPICFMLRLQPSGWGLWSILSRLMSLFYRLSVGFF